MTFSELFRRPAWALAVSVAVALSAAPAGAVDWGAVKGKDVTMFYPGQASFEWALTTDPAAQHDGAVKLKKDGKNCMGCHTNEEKKKGDAIVVGKSLQTGPLMLEPHPIPGKAPLVTANIKFAHDATNLYVRIEFTDPPAAGPKQDADNAAKFTMILGDKTVPEFTRFGCFATCHDNLSSMPSGETSDTTKYLYKTRAKMGRQGGADLKGADDLAKLKADGYQLEYWQAKLNPGKPAVGADGFIFDKRIASATPAVTAEGTFENGKAVVILTRKLAAPAPYKAIEAGKTYTVGFAIHGGYAAKRYHWVSLEHTLVLDKGEADFVAP